MTLGDRIAVLDRGRLQQVGRPEELYASPCNIFVAGFIGPRP
jgi:multiple sugar transport system ATP-binding protein